jgi:hypothetical protein
MEAWVGDWRRKRERERSGGQDVLVSVLLDVEVTHHAKGMKGSSGAPQKEMLECRRVLCCSVLESDAFGRHVGLVPHLDLVSFCSPTN